MILEGSMIKRGTPVIGKIALSPCAACEVREFGICAPLAEHELGVVQAYKSGDRVLAAGTELYAQGEPLRELYNLLDGWVFQYKLLEDGRRQILKIALPGDFMGFQPDLQAPMDHSAQVLTEARVCVFPRDNIVALMREHPSLAIRLTQMMAREDQLSREQITSLGRRTARERVAYFLIDLFYRLRLRLGEAVGDKIPLPLTQEQVGDLLGLTSVHVNRTLRGLRENGLIRVSNRTLYVTDPDRLAETAGFDETFFDQP
jgi:CRP-like cAMP-binding protein